MKSGKIVGKKEFNKRSPLFNDDKASPRYFRSTNICRCPGFDVEMSWSTYKILSPSGCRLSGVDLAILPPACLPGSKTHFVASFVPTFRQVGAGVALKQEEKIDPKSDKIKETALRTVVCSNTDGGLRVALLPMSQIWKQLTAKRRARHTEKNGRRFRFLFDVEFHIKKPSEGIEESVREQMSADQGG
ncbi:uncharacterized protein SPSK_10535 [Sporothrix schenckii 1099-18]|uniref:Uncharacterized protein n=1 Tax=Sporothrix schenckii 1099-18 TaxID=1397361 RepID=A0A0F2M235_SPOSC|nr:uncharacterized protein SPSK_10535 [Sporothrix schenckii 1099-18]KJR82196.1 hypothetical protein SPSK_10535 [Sporothrix schenckii 1099-18]